MQVEEDVLGEALVVDRLIVVHGDQFASGVGQFRIAGDDAVGDHAEPGTVRKLAAIVVAGVMSFETGGANGVLECLPVVMRVR